MGAPHHNFSQGKARLHAHLPSNEQCLRRIKSKGKCKERKCLRNPLFQFCVRFYYLPKLFRAGQERQHWVGNGMHRDVYEWGGGSAVKLFPCHRPLVSDKIQLLFQSGQSQVQYTR